MPRPENPIDPAGGPLADLAIGLRALRQDAGLNYRDLAEKVGYSAGVLSRAARGRELPTWPVTSAFVRGCGADDQDWRPRWERAQAAVRREPVARIDSVPPEAATPAKPALPGVFPRAARVGQVDPRAARTPAEFVELMNELRAWANQPSLRTIMLRAKIKGYDLPRSTLSGALNRDRLPSHNLMIAFVVACGAPDVQAWITTWRGLCDPARLQEEEPYLDARVGVSWFRRRSLRRLVPLALVALLGVSTLMASGTLLLPFTTIPTVKGTGQSTSLLKDPRVERLLMAEGIRVTMGLSGTRDTPVPDDTDFVLAAGEPQTRAVVDARAARGQFATVYRPTISPLALAVRRDRAEALVRAGVARPQSAGSLYYDLDFARLLDLIDRKATWRDLGIADDNIVLVHTTNPCRSNLGATYLGLAAHTLLGHPPRDPEEIDLIAALLGRYVSGQGAQPDSSAELMSGPLVGRIIAVREQDYLAHQLARSRTGEIDRDTVLLYPNVGVDEVGTFVALTPTGVRLGEALTANSDLRARIVELGYRVPDASGPELADALRAQGVPAPEPRPDTPIAPLPSSQVLVSLIDHLGECQ
ncbi:MAG TPA: helix-turn-helix transcriptional regulator [Actinokineospora sp.]|nr:helix-turn-helix transcriptional regulator [Actinokineospora sp.]